jgi:hypothetical protein
MALDGKIGVVDGGKSAGVSARRQDSSQFGLSDLDAAWHNQRGVTQIDKRHVAAGSDAPTVPKLGGKARLSSLRYLCAYYVSHRCIVHRVPYKATPICS